MKSSKHKSPWESSLVEVCNVKTAFITGASRGIGLAIAKGYAKEGINVFLVATNKTKIDQVVEEINSQNIGRAAGTVADVTDEFALSQAFSEAVQTFGGIDAVVANAGVNSPSGSLESMTSSAFKSMFEVNTFGVMNTCRLALKIMKERGGDIITLGSGIGHHGAGNNSAYAASKAASWMLTKSLAAEYVNSGIRINELIPGPVKTDMNPNADGTGWKEPEDVVPLAVFLVSQGENGPTGQSFSLMRR